MEQPAEPEPFCQRIRIRAYPTEEYLGLIFVYLGEGDPPPLPRFPDFEAEAGREVNIYLRRCNFTHDLENDSAHTWFVHGRPGHSFREWDGRVPTTESWEDEFGLTEVATSPSGWKNISHRGLPDIVVRKQNPGDGASPRQEHTIAWEVPVDDESHLLVNVDVALFPDEAPRPTRSPNWVDPDDLGLEVLTGRLSQHDVTATQAIGEVSGGRVTDLVKFQDSVSQGGQGRIVDRSTEHLGATDTRVVLWRKLWERELRALAEGRSLKQWYRPESHVTGL